MAVASAAAAVALFTSNACALKADSDTTAPDKQDGAPDLSDGGSPTDASSPDTSAEQPSDGGLAVDRCAPGVLPHSSVAVAFADTVLTRWPEATSIYPVVAFEYEGGIVLRGIERVYQLTGDPKYLSYIKTYVDTFVSADGTLNIPSTFSFDNLQPAIFFPFLWKETGDNKYKLAAEKVRNRYDTIPRGPSGGFWHQDRFPNQMWLDGVYMGAPFLARYGATFDCGAFCADTIAFQTNLIAQHTQDPATGLLYHAWDESRAAGWADPTTGRSPIVWGRALGWYAMSLVDTLRDIPADHPSRPGFIQMFQQVAAAVRTYQDPASGLWYQVVDKGDLSDNWLETSASGMFVYALKLGVLRGYIDASYLDVAERGWQGMKTRISFDSTGPVMTGTVIGMGVQKSYSGYINQRRLSNSPHGLCAILLAATAMETDCDY